MLITDAPIITIFVRHSPGCPHTADELYQSCTCRKHLRWSSGGKQYRKTAGTRTWKKAEAARAQLIAKLSKDPRALETEQMLSAAITSFLMNKEAQGVGRHTLNMYKRELARLLAFAEKRNAVTVISLTLDLLTSFRDTWPSLYPSSYTRAIVQKRLKNFLKFCYDAGWLPRIPALSSIKITEPETEPLTGEQYASLLRVVKDTKLRALIQLMRWSGLAVQDASTLKRSHLDFDSEKNLYRIVSSRVKTKTHLYIPIPPEIGEELLTVMNGNPEYVFWENRGGTAKRQAGRMSEEITAAFAEAKIESAGHMISHRLRATFAVDLLQKGVPLEHVSKLLGHRSVSTTERHYAKWVKGRQDQLDSLVAGTWTGK